MSNQFSSTKNGSVTVFIYEHELDFLKWLVLQKPDIETGGDLFGLWQDESTAVVQLILGPGEKCRRTTTSFYQDVSYLREVGGTPPIVNIGCFLFNVSEQKMLTGNIKCLPCPSPVRKTVDATYITSEAEPTQDWRTFMKYQASMQRNNKATVNKATKNDSNAILKESKPKRTAKTRNGSANTASTPSTRNGSLGSGNDDLNAENNKAYTEDRAKKNVESTTSTKGNDISDLSSKQNSIANVKNTRDSQPSTSNMESPTLKDGEGISSKQNNNQEAAITNMKKRKPNKKDNQVKNHNPPIKAKKSKSNKRSKKAGKRKKRRDQEERNEDDYGEEDTLLDETEEQELSICSKLCKRLRAIGTTIRQICGCC